MKAALGVMLGVFAFVSACHTRPRDAQTPDPLDLELWHEPAPPTTCAFPRHELPRCMTAAREVRAWGSLPREGVPNAECPIFVRVSEAGVVAEPVTGLHQFDPVPREECIPSQYLIGARRTLKVDDGWLVAYASPFEGEVFWTDDDGEERHFISRARLAGFVKAPSGTILALGIGHARLGRGGVIALDHRGHGEYVPRLVATMPLEPTPVVHDDRGAILTYAQGFVVRIDEKGRLENLHYVARDVGRVASLARAADGSLFLGLECGVLRVTKGPPGTPSREDWWSARDGASGHWSSCTSVRQGDSVVVPPPQIY